jgi:hypothetical protein
VVSFTSLDRDEAGARLRTISEALTALGIAHDKTTDAIAIPTMRLVFRVTTCSIRSVGFTSIMLVADEMARWESRDTAANPAREVMASQRPTMATQPNGIEVCCSSPWGTDDYHNELFDLGDTDHQQVSFAPSWVANPTLTESTTRELEPDDKIWSREYAAIPGATISQALDRADVLASFAPTLCIEADSSPFCAIDSSKLRNDEFTCLFGYASADGLQVDRIGSWDPTELRCITLGEIVEQIAANCRSRRIVRVFGDDFESLGLTSEFARHHIIYHPYAWSETSKDAAFQTLRRLMRDRRLRLAEHEKLRDEMIGCKAHLRPNGRTNYPTNGLDFLSALVTAAHAINDLKIDLRERIDWEAYHRRNIERLALRPRTIYEQLGGTESWRRESNRPSWTAQSIEDRQSSALAYNISGKRSRDTFGSGF